MSTFTNLVPNLYAAIDVVSREPVGGISSVTLDASSSRAAKDQSIYVPIAPVGAIEDVTPGQLPLDTGDQTIDSVAVVIDKAKQVPFRLTGEDFRGLGFGPGYDKIRVGQIAQAIRTLTNAVETDIAASHLKACRAFGTAGTTPFATDLSDIAQVRKILVDNGAPLTDLQLLIDTAAGAQLRSLGILSKANEAGGTEARAVGSLLDIYGFSVKESAGIVTFTHGTKQGTATATAAVSATTVAVTVSAASGDNFTFLAGDLVSIGGVKYVVAAAATILAGVTANITIAKPGLKTAASGAALTLPLGSGVTTSARNLAFSRNAIVLAARSPAMPEGGDSASDGMQITDPVSGLTFEFLEYKQTRRVRYEVSLAWGVKVIKPEHLGILLG